LKTESQSRRGQRSILTGAVVSLVSPRGRCLDEYVSIEGVARDYGVVITGSFDDLTRAVDEAASAELRTSLRASRAYLTSVLPAGTERP